MNDAAPLRILVLDYLCVPGRGSERGAGWGMLRALQRFGTCTVITAPESADAITEWNDEHPGEEIAVEVVAEPSWATVAKRTRIGEFLTYLAWQRRAHAFVLRSEPRHRYDVACHVTLSAFWLPSMATDLGIPSIWGPVGGAVATPRQLWPLLGWKGVVVEIFDWVAVWTMSLYPSTRRTWRVATVRVAQNLETVKRLPPDLRTDTVVLNHALFHDVGDVSALSPVVEAGRGVDPYVAWVSPMESRKGPELAIRALAMTPEDVPLLMVGDGPELARMKVLARTLGVEDRITFAGRVPREAALTIMRNAVLTVFTGLREEGGLALAEAMLLGTPVVVLGHGGAAVIARSATDTDRVTIVQPAGLEQTVAAMGKAIDYQYRRSSSQPHAAHAPLIDAHAASLRLGRALHAAVEPSGGS